MSKDIFQEFLNKGYSVEYQTFEHQTTTGNYNVVFGEHNADLQSTDSETYYYICNEDGYKLYNLEFDSIEALQLFIVYALTYEVDIDAVGEDDELYQEHHKTLLSIINQEPKLPSGIKLGELKI